MNLQDSSIQHELDVLRVFSYNLGDRLGDALLRALGTFEILAEVEKFNRGEEHVAFFANRIARKNVE